MWVLRLELWSSYSPWLMRESSLEEANVRSPKQSICTVQGQHRKRVTSQLGVSGEDSPEGEGSKQRLQEKSGNWSYQTHLCPNEMVGRARDFHRTQASNFPLAPSSLLQGTLLGGSSVLGTYSECKEGGNCPKLEWSSTCRKCGWGDYRGFILWSWAVHFPSFPPNFWSHLVWIPYFSFKL